MRFVIKRTGDKLYPIVIWDTKTNECRGRYWEQSLKSAMRHCEAMNKKASDHEDTTPRDASGLKERDGQRDA